MGNLWKYVIMAVGVVLAAVVVAAAYTEGHRPQPGTITVTGLGETEFTSDLVVINGYFEADDNDAAKGYSTLEEQRAIITSFLIEKGVKSEDISFDMPSTRKLSEPWVENGEYMGTRFAGYRTSQEFCIESTDVEAVEAAARALPSLIAKGISIEVYNPQYYYSQLETVKLGLIASAAADARERAKKIAKNSGSEIGDLKLSRAGVFQITAATGDEEFSAGGSFNLSSREKKARVTVRSEFYINND